MLGFALTCFAAAASAAAFASAYDTAVLADRPAVYLPLSAPRGSGEERDLSPNRHYGSYLPRGASPMKTRLPNGDIATVFDGQREYLEIASHLSFSVSRQGLTLEAWIRPDTLNFPRSEGDSYVYWMGKGEPGQHEYAGRMYSRNSARPNRVSGYVFNLSGGLGSGSYFQDAVRRGEWMHVAIVVDKTNVAIYKNGGLRKTTPLSQFNVRPEPGNAPVRLGTRDGNSFFKGAIGKFAIYPKALSASRIRAHFDRMR